MSTGTTIDPVGLAADLIRCPSVTPAEGGALDLLERELKALGFVCHRLPFEKDGTYKVDNLYARLGTAAPNFCFAGHTDVVPVGAEGEWKVGPFEGKVEDGILWGRGAADMKSAIASFVAAVASYLDEKGAPSGSISLLITGDEEGDAVNGTVRMLDWLEQNGEKIDHCVVGEPTNPHEMGEMVKIGRRGSINGWLTVRGTQGHVAYPHRADNPVPHLVAMLARLDALQLDDGTEHFQPSNLEITTVDVGNTASNVIPAEAHARFNIRFNDLHSGASLEEMLKKHVEAVAEERNATIELRTVISGESFLTQTGPFTDLVAGAVESVLGRTPELSTSGGTSDARFIKNHCPVVEFGLVGETMHKVDERVPTSDVEMLAKIYRTMLDGYFAKAEAFADETR